MVFSLSLSLSPFSPQAPPSLQKPLLHSTLCTTLKSTVQLGSDLLLWLDGLLCPGSLPATGSPAKVIAYVSTSSFHSARRLWAAAASSRSHVDPCALDGAVARSAVPKASLPAQ